MEDKPRENPAERHFSRIYKSVPKRLWPPSISLRTTSTLSSLTRPC
jgi:hypothetical protein